MQDGCLKLYSCFASLGYCRMVCDEDECFACAVSAQVFYKLPFRFGIEGGSSFVQQQDVSGTEEGAGDGDTLGLSFAEAATLFVEVGIYSVR